MKKERNVEPNAQGLKSFSDVRIGIIGLGYVGLPLAVEFGKKFSTVGFDINQSRVDELASGKDHTLECSPEELASAAQLEFSTDISKLQTANCYIVTVPTPVDDSNRPDLTPLIKASETVGKVISKGDVVIYESTVYPGATEEDCIPVVEKVSGLEFNKDFFAGYSPERINPGDKEHRLPTIRKVTSGSTPEVTDFVNELYLSIITAGTHKAPSIKAAEAAKVIENTQRDVNIGLINELSMIFNKLGIDTLDVLEAAGSKWNFLPFRPGLVGGHCIGVDPFYLTHKAQQVGFHPEMILAGRRTNDNMGKYVVSEIVKLMLHRCLSVKNSKVLVLGITFKENCPDVRNTKAVDLVSEFKEYGCNVDVFDPWANPDEVLHEYGISLLPKSQLLPSILYDAVILAVAHDEFREMGAGAIRTLMKPDGVLYDIKYVFPKESVDGRL
ncbi:Vi polysaccharide biosynthesis UDP-N-acetylglucosamine C-6 dehydrogenase TviB [Tichowtungia aerotolerans]|uniref:Vi polysaccharide biosynthesis UDP-N-acetylglucosamine C-6 dehydrogenase TviB n=1 Tax=Tichowtungia aerotolerans TaxID=2697043 RepID=A0A6P1M810_9BACT|nr:Vi polysaccharide biosynthesis UDP-N-acetylglucosamine C-6 dehydrogenase TviB [Tichowtungia aerotolerans]QHI70182.1 Vi polysaccharide biosynthesis UDP-N-acetylglucosamine C-6 dehydrogenase TviB [Tichowtungia aerotolerans]